MSYITDLNANTYRKLKVDKNERVSVQSASLQKCPWKVFPSRGDLVATQREGDAMALFLSARNVYDMKKEKEEFR